MRLLLLLYLMMSVISFVAFGVDKYKAKKGAWRIRERTLFILALAGGGIGAYLGMKTFHHKTLHKQFRIGLPLIMAVQILILGYLLVREQM